MLCMAIVVVTRGKEVAPERPARDVAGELEALESRAAIVEARPHACVDDLPLEVVHGLERVDGRPVVRGAVGGASDGDVDVVRPEDDGVHFCLGSGHAGVRCGVFGVIRCREQRRPPGIRLCRGVSIDLSIADRHDWAPEEVVVLGVPARDCRVAVDEITHGEHTRRVNEVHSVRDRNVLECLV